MKQRRYIQIGWTLLLTILLAGLIVTPVHASGQTTRHTLRHDGTTSINATIYLATATLLPVFQSRIDQQVPGSVNNAIAGIVSQLPAADRGWALQMAMTLIQPSASLTRLAPQQGGLAASLRVSLYPGDPQPITANMLVKFSVIDSTTVQVSIQPLNGSPALVSGPIATFQIPIGQLSSIISTPACGDAALAVNLQFPVSLGQGQTSEQNQRANTSTRTGIIQEPAHSQMQRASANGTTSYVELPASSLASLGNGVGTIPLGNNMSAQNIQIAVDSANDNLLITSDIMLGTSFRLGVATTTVKPIAVNGSLAVSVLNTTLTVLQIFTFPDNTYNQQIQQILNAKLNGALAGKFNVMNAAIGANSHIPCAASDSLVVTGTTNLM